jgi:hypothetical protein
MITGGAVERIGEDSEKKCIKKSKRRCCITSGGGGVLQNKLEAVLITGIKYSIGRLTDEQMRPENSELDDKENPDVLISKTVEKRNWL